MRFKTEELMTLVMAEIAAITQRYEQEHAKQLEKDHNDNVAYVITHREDWNQFVGVINAALASDWAITIDDVPIGLRDYNNSVRLYRAPRRSESADKQIEIATRELRSLVELLKKTTSDEVSVSVLQKAGFSLGSILRNVQERRR